LREKALPSALLASVWTYLAKDADQSIEKAPVIAVDRYAAPGAIIPARLGTWGVACDFDHRAFLFACDEPAAASSSGPV